MKKENFVTLVLGVIGGLLFALGMCMCLLPEWNMFLPGEIFTATGAIFLILTAIVYRGMTGKTPMKVNPKTIGKILYGIVSAAVFGTGMSMVLVFEGMMLYGILVGIIGIVMLLGLIPMCIGLK